MLDLSFTEKTSTPDFLGLKRGECVGKGRIFTCS